MRAVTTSWTGPAQARARPGPPGAAALADALPEAPLGGGAPKLRLVKSIADLAALGIGGENYGRLVLEQAAWEARYGLRTADLQTEDLSLDGAPAVGPAMPQAPTPDEVASA
jgi:hypothetical protein